MLFRSQLLNPSYGYLWWLNGKSTFMAPGFQFQFPGSWSPSAPADMFAAMGKNGQLLNIVPSMNLVWVRMGEEPSGSFVPFALNDTIWQKLNAVMCTPTGLITPKSKTWVTVFPNPAEGFIHVQSSFPGRVQVMDMSGRDVLPFELPAGESSVDIQSLSDGMYQLVFVAPSGERQVQKLMIRNQ